MLRISLPLTLVLLATSACSGSKTDADYKADITTGMHDSLLTGINDLLQAAKDMQAAAPTPSGRGWDATQDAAALTTFTAAWVRARAAYEKVEGALAPIFPDLDYSIDARYDDFLAQIGASGDTYLFDDQGVTGMHAIERILFAPTTPQKVVDFESTVPGYTAAAFPATEQEAADFKNKLCAKLVTDVQTMHDQWTPQIIDLGGAFQGLISLMNEQREKVNKASTNEEESRYSQHTMVDIRDNLTGTTAIYGLFEPWLKTKTNADATKDGVKIDASIQAGFATLQTLYGQVTGDAIPQPPDDWSAESPTPANLATPFGKLYSGVQAAVDPATPGAVVYEMNQAAIVLGFPEFVETQ